MILTLSSLHAAFKKSDLCMALDYFREMAPQEMSEIPQRQVDQQRFADQLLRRRLDMLEKINTFCISLVFIIFNVFLMRLFEKMFWRSLAFHFLGKRHMFYQTKTILHSRIPALAASIQVWITLRFTGDLEFSGTKWGLLG